MSLLSVHTVFFTALGYPMSYLEFFGTLLNLLAVWLMTRKHVWAWPIGIMAVILFGALFYQVRLYSDFLEQVYYMATGFWGWWLWSRGDPASASTKGIRVSRNTSRANALLGIGIMATTAVLGWLMSRIHLLAPRWFPAPASFPYLDAFTTAASFFAQMLAAHKKLENWQLWIVVDAISVALYIHKEVRFVAALYFAFLLLALKGLAAWRAELEASAPAQSSVRCSC